MLIKYRKRLQTHWVFIWATSAQLCHWQMCWPRKRKSCSWDAESLCQMQKRKTRRCFYPRHSGNVGHSQATLSGVCENTTSSIRVKITCSECFRLKPVLQIPASCVILELVTYSANSTEGQKVSDSDSRMTHSTVSELWTNTLISFHDIK